MSVEKYIVLGENGSHDYDLEVKNEDGVKTFSLYFSKGEQWNDEHKGELVLSMVDDGNGVKFDRKLKKLDYAELLYLRIILNFEHKTNPNPLEREDHIVLAMSNEIYV